MITLLVLWSMVTIYLLIRNEMVYKERMKMIEYYFDVDPNGYKKTGRTFHQFSVPYHVMVLRFWVFPISRFYPAYHASK